MIMEKELSEPTLNIKLKLNTNINNRYIIAWVCHEMI